MIPAELPDIRQACVQNERALVSCRAYAIDPAGLTFIADIVAYDIAHDMFDFDFVRTAPSDAGSCAFRAALFEEGTATARTVECTVQSGGGGIDEDRVGRWTFTVRVHFHSQPAEGLRVSLSWPRMNLEARTAEIGAAALRVGLARSLEMTRR